MEEAGAGVACSGGCELGSSTGRGGSSNVEVGVVGVLLVSPGVGFGFELGWSVEG